MKKEKEASTAEKKRKAATHNGKNSKKLKIADDVTTASTKTQTTYRCTYCEAAWSDSDLEVWIQCDECSLWTHASCAGYESDEDLDDVAFFAACELGILLVTYWSNRQNWL